MRARSEFSELVDRLVASRQATAAVAVVQVRQRPPIGAWSGRLDSNDEESRVGVDALFDLASLTKVLSGTLAMVLDESGELLLSTRLGEIWPTVDSVLAEVTLEDLLRHKAGFRRWMPLYAVCSSPEDLPRQLLDGRWVDASEPTYSDLDYLLWGLSVERALGVGCIDLFAQRLFSVLGSEAFCCAGTSSDRVVGCLLTTGREVELAASVGIEVVEQAAPRRGEPQDGNCRFLGRPSGHAGLFGSAAGMLALGREFLTPSDLLTSEAVHRALEGQDRYATGWFRRSETRAGKVLGSRAFGHEGFTGGSLWVDPDDGLVVVLAAHRRSLDVDLSEARAQLHRLALDL